MYNPMVNKEAVSTSGKVKGLNLSKSKNQTLLCLL